MSRSPKFRGGARLGVCPSKGRAAADRHQDEADRRDVSKRQIRRRQVALAKEGAGLVK
jgi:hypothetical protein